MGSVEAPAYESQMREHCDLSVIVLHMAYRVTRRDSRTLRAVGSALAQRHCSQVSSFSLVSRKEANEGNNVHGDLLHQLVGLTEPSVGSLEDSSDDQT